MRAAPEFDAVHISVDDILVVGYHRGVNHEEVTARAESIERIGLQTPITVRVQKNVPHPETGEVLASAHVLVAGQHRLEAYRKLGRRDIPAKVLECSQLEAELWALEENLARSELTADEKTEHTLRLAGFIKLLEESRENPEFLDKAEPTTGRGHKGMVRKVAERVGVDHSSIRHRAKKASTAIAEPVDLDRDSPAELFGEADKFKALAANPKAERKAARKKDREKPAAGKLAAAIRDLNSAWSSAAIEMAAAGLTDPEKAELRQHLPDVIKKLQRLADSIDLKAAIAIAAEAASADQPSLFGSN